MSDAETGFEAYLDYLGSLRESGADYFLEGGQAVNYWAEYVDSEGRGAALSLMRPFTSKDCDIWVSSHTWDKLKRDPKMQTGGSPADGQLGILTLSEDPPRVVDVLSSVYGIDVKQYPKLLERALDDGTLKVIDPVYLFLSKCHCVMNLPQAGRQDERHVRMLSLILPEYIVLLVGEVESGLGLTPRDLLQGIKLLKKFAATAVCRRAMSKLGIDATSLIPWDRLIHSSSVVLVRFGESQAPA